MPSGNEPGVGDATRRTHLANERTYLAWWRTGLTTLTVALASARVVPELANAEVRWPYTTLGIAFAILGTICVGYAEQRRRAVDKAIKQGEFSDVSGTLALTLSVTGVVLGIGLIVLIAVGN